MIRTRAGILGIALSFVAGCAVGPPALDDDDGPDAHQPMPDAQDGATPPFNRGVCTLAGAAAAGNVDGNRDDGRFNNPVNVAYGRDGNVYVADFDNDAIRVVDLSGRVQTVISQVGFQRPVGLAFDLDRTLYVSTDYDDTGGRDAVSGTVWRVDIRARTATVIARHIGRPHGLTVLASGTLLLSDSLHHVVETLDPETGKVVIIAGTWDDAGKVDATGAAARFSTPSGIVDRGDGSVAIADYGNDAIRTVTIATGEVATLDVIEKPEDPAVVAERAVFDHPQAMAIDANGALYVTDTDTFRVRRIQNGMAETIAGDGSPGYLDSEDRLAARFYGLEGMSVTSDGGIIFVADGTRGESLPYNRVRQIIRPK